MDISRRSDYACRILRAAYNSGENYISVTDIAEEEDIPYAFARSIQHDLVKSGLVRTIRGARGGLVLNCDPKTTTVRDVLEAVQGPITVSLCSADPEYCDKQPECAYNRVWLGADKILQDYFESIILDDLFQQGEDHPAIQAVLGCEDPYGTHCSKPKGA